MKCVILAAGKGTRLQPLTLTTPKPLIVVAGKPLLDHVVEALPDSIDGLIIVVSYLQEQIRAYCGETFHGLPVTYVHQEETLGTAHALMLCKELLSGSFMVVPADDIHDKEALARLATHDLGILVAPSDHPERFGVVSLNPDGTLLNITEKPAAPTSNLVSTAVLVLDDRIFTYAMQKSEAHQEYILPDLVNELANHAPVAVERETFWVPINRPEEIAEAEVVLRQKLGA